MGIFVGTIIQPTTECKTKNYYDYKSLIYLGQYDSLAMVKGLVLMDSCKGIVGRESYQQEFCHLCSVR